jgi:hypothetical protein
MKAKSVKLSEIKVNPNNPRLIRCQTCETEFTSKKQCKSRTPKFCTKKCYATSLLKPKEPKQPRKSRKGILLSNEWKAALSEGRKNSDKCKGENLYNWKGGKSTERLRLKQSMYKRKLNLKKEFDQSFLSKVLIAQKNKCFFCEKKFIEYKAIEHLTPVSRGGDNDNYNLVYSCKSCNSTKRQNTLEEFAIKNRRFDWIDKFDFVYATATLFVENATVKPILKQRHNSDAKT